MPVVLLKLLQTNKRQLLCCTANSNSCWVVAVLLPNPEPPPLPLLLLLPVAVNQLRVSGAVLPPTARGCSHDCIHDSINSTIQMLLKPKRRMLLKPKRWKPATAFAEALQYFATVFFALLMTTAAVLVFETLANSSNRLSLT
jgi:hypothetical protein